MLFVPFIDFPLTVKVNPLALQPLRESRQVVRSQRVQHALDIFNTAGDFESTFINTSQSIDRMASGCNDDVIPCITPKGDFFSMRHKRYITGLVLKYFCSNIMFWLGLSAPPPRHWKTSLPILPSPQFANLALDQCRALEDFIFDCLLCFFEVWKLISGTSRITPKELHSLAGNAYNVKAVAAAYACALSMCDLEKFNTAVEKRHANWEKKDLTVSCVRSSTVTHLIL